MIALLIATFSHSAGDGYSVSKKDETNAHILRTDIWDSSFQKDN